MIPSAPSPPLFPYTTLFRSVVDGEREEILPLARRLVGHRGDQQNGAFAGDHHRAAGLPCDLAGFERDRLVAVLEALGNFCHLGFLDDSFDGPARTPVPVGRPRPAWPKKSRGASLRRGGVRLYRRRPSFSIRAL